jgi:hypothetical protein
VTDIRVAQRRLERTFRKTFTVENVAEPLLSFDDELPSRRALQVLERRRFVVAGVREAGLVTGYVLASDLRRSPAALGSVRREFETGDLIGQDEPLDECLRRLADRERLFVMALGAVAGIVTASDMQKAPARMWLFGVVTLIEATLTGLIETWFPGDSWLELVSSGRRERAEAIQRERWRVETAASVRLLDCLQLSDKGQILLKHQETRKLLGFASKDAGERAVRRLTRLRDSLAHSADIVTDDWDMVQALARNLDELVKLGSTFARVPRGKRR